MGRSVFFLGNHPALSVVEVVTVLQREGVRFEVEQVRRGFMVVELENALVGQTLATHTSGESPSGDAPDEFALLDGALSGLLDRLGGVDRIGKVLGERAQRWDAVGIVQTLGSLPEKLTVGLSVVDPQEVDLRDLARELKKQAREAGSRLRFVLPKGRKRQLNAAQVLFNKLLAAPNRELTILGDGKRFYLVDTVAVQDIAAYERRDTARPARDARVGLLPPKLAQIMLNLVPSFVNSLNSPSQGDVRRPRILDPFCGMGTVLQEGWLMGYAMVGSDASQRMIAAAEENLSWLAGGVVVDDSLWPHLLRHDVRQPFARDLDDTFDAIVTEPYLGKPVTTPLSESQIGQRWRDLGMLYQHFFRNARLTLREGGWVVLALPAMARHSGHNRDFVFSPTWFIDSIHKEGYRMEHLGREELADLSGVTERGTLLYARPNAFIGREITMWQKV